jgi:glyoxylate carboligase
VKAANVADYIVERLAGEGIRHCFGVAGDYLFPICDAVDSSTGVKWIGCANELNASYAADGYAHVCGAAMLATTYGVGELSAMNGVMGAKAERSLVFHVVGMPSYQRQRVRKFAPITPSATACSAIRLPVRQCRLLSCRDRAGELHRRSGAGYREGGNRQADLKKRFEECRAAANELQR